jgi:DNA-directed RNA polymerase specialized sigma24 family protein
LEKPLPTLTVSPENECLNLIETEPDMGGLHTRLLRMARHYASCSRLESDDLLQEAWLTVLEARRTHDAEIGPLAPFLLQRARWSMLDTIKRARLRAQSLAPQPGFEIRDPDTGGLQALEADEFIAALAPAQAAILRCLLNGMTWRETGCVLGFSSANVAYHVRKMRRHYEMWMQETAKGL